MTKFKVYPLVIASCLVFFTGCALMFSYLLTKEEMDVSIDKARRIALESGKLLPSERTEVERHRPAVSYYRLGGDVLQYYFSWPLSSNRTAMVYGLGDIKTFEGAKFEIDTKPKK